LASVLCLLEIFSSAPGEEQVIDCVGKLIAFRQGRRRTADKEGPRHDHEEKAKPAAPFVKPFLWIITAGRPSSV
jgi:hypothetical protein